MNDAAMSGGLARTRGAPAARERASLRRLAGFGALAAAIVAASLWSAPGVAGWLGAALGLTALAAAAIDARAFIIPDELNLAMAALGLAAAVVDAPHAPAAALAEAALRGASFGLAFLALRAVYRLWRGREGIGLGDVKLAAAAGIWLDWTVAPLAVEAAALSALGVCLALHVSGRRPLERMARLPFGLFLAPAVWLGWLLQRGAFGFGGLT